MAVPPLEQLPETLRNVRTRPLFNFFVQVSKPQIVGTSPEGYRRVGVIASGLIGMQYRGFRYGPADVLARIDGGEVVDPSQYYMRIVPFFETAAPQYDWLNRIVAVGIGHRNAEGALYSIFELL